MRKAIISLLLLSSLMLSIIGCGERATLPVEAGMGPRPTLPAPNPTLIPTVNIAPAKGWPDGAKPTAAAGLSVNVYASGLDHPRWLYVLPNGDVLVAETNAPPKDSKGIKDWIMKLLKKRAGAGVPSANRITLLRDSDADGIADMRTVFLQGLNSPFGMALVENDFYVANTDALIRYPYQQGETQITAPGVKIADLPAGPINRSCLENYLFFPVMRPHLQSSVK
jgi:glucose/arabinose dehydrogenase